MRQLMAHQQVAIDFAERAGNRVGLFMGVGTGKTLTSIRWALDKMPVLIICRKDDIFTWALELEQEGLKADVIATKGKQISYKSNWAITTHDRVKNPEVLKYIRNRGFKAVILDEAHAVKRTKARRSKIIVKETASIPYAVALTGTPMTNNALEDLFGICLFVDRGKALGDNFYSFRQRYFMQAGFKWIPHKGAAERIMARIKNFCFFLKTGSVIKLPPKRKFVIECEMSEQQRKYYEMVIDDWEIAINDEIFEINHAVVVASKLRQIACGFLYRPELPPLYMRCPKVDALLELVGETGRLAGIPKIVIWCAHTAEIIRLSRLLGDKCVVYYGRANVGKAQARLRFRDDPNCRFFIGQVDSGVGMNELIVSNTAVYFSNSLRVVSRQQSEGRTRRKGSEGHETIDYYDIVTAGSIEAEMLKSLRSDEEFADKLARGIMAKNKALVRSLIFPSG